MSVIIYLPIYHIHTFKRRKTMYAETKPCKVLYKPCDEKYSPDIRRFQGCPTIAVTKNGRIFLGWYSGGTGEPRIENYNIISYSDDNGKTFKNLLIIPSDEENMIHALDIQLYVSGDGALHVVWVQNNAIRAGVGAKENWCSDHPMGIQEGVIFLDLKHSSWEVVCQDPDADDIIFDEPKYVFDGFMRCKPLTLSNGNIITFAYDQLTANHGYNISYDGGKTWERRYGGRKLKTFFDENMAYEKKDGSVVMYSRCELGCLAKGVSLDGGLTFSDDEESEIEAPATRFFISRTPSGRIILVHNDDKKIRKNMSIWLSDDDGESWPHRVCIDERSAISYPDIDFYDGKIYMTYDRERTGAKEIFFSVFTEDDIINGRPIDVKIVSKPGLTSI